jgi:hypothetical protein
VLLADLLAGAVGDDIDELVDSDHLLRPDIDWAGKIRAEQPHRAFEALVDIQERARLLAVAHTSMSSPSRAMATFRQIAAGASSRPSVQVPSGPKILWYRAIYVRTQ